MMFESVELNNLSYCEAHARDICHDCTLDFSILNEQIGFEIPENGEPEYPSPLMDERFSQIRTSLGKRWLDMQRVLNPGEQRPFTTRLIQLPTVQVPEEVRTSTAALQPTLLQMFRQLQGMASQQRYFFANQAKIMLEDYDTFVEAAVLYEMELSDMLSRKFDLYHWRHGHRPGDAQRKYEHRLKAKGSILNAFGFFLELNTQRAFWRALELTAEAFVMHLDYFNEVADDQVVVTDKAKASLLQCVGHVFWSLQHAQFRLNQLRVLQHLVYQRDVFPFYPISVKALECNADIDLIIAELSKASLYDFPSVSSLFSKFRQASNFMEQMQDVNVEVMAAIDELSTMFRVMEVLLHAAHLVATEVEIKTALMTYNFEPNGEEVNSKMDDVAVIITEVPEAEVRIPTPKRLSFLQKLIVKENSIRQKHSDRFLRASSLTMHSRGFTRDMFNAFKSSYEFLYRESIRREFKEEERSLLPMDIARRFQHRKEVGKLRRSRAAKDYKKADIAEARLVPETTPLDPALFWEVGDGALEKYVPPFVLEKVKTRKQQESTDAHASSFGEQPQPFSSNSDNSAASATASAVQRAVDKLKEGDLTTRDLLWRKVKGTLKWSNLVQLLTRLGCWILNLDGSKTKVVDPLTGRCTVLHKPHPSDDCRPDQRDSYRVHIEDWLKIEYSQLVAHDEAKQSRTPAQNGVDEPLQTSERSGF